MLKGFNKKKEEEEKKDIQNKFLFDIVVIFTSTLVSSSRTYIQVALLSLTWFAVFIEK